MESKYGQSDCKCIHYREKFPNCSYESNAVSDHSPGSVKDNEILIRTIFRENDIDKGGLVKPVHFRQDPVARGFSVDRVSLMGTELLEKSKLSDKRYDGFLKFVSVPAKELRELLEGEKRLFCIYDTGTPENKFHADICQNLVYEKGIDNRKNLMKEISWILYEAFSNPKSDPPA